MVSVTMNPVYYRLLNFKRPFLTDFFIVDVLKTHTSHLQVFMQAACITSPHKPEWSTSVLMRMSAPTILTTNNTVSFSVYSASSLKLYFYCALSSLHFCIQSTPCISNSDLLFCFSPCFKQQVKSFCLI